MKTKTIPMKTFKVRFEVELDESQLWPNEDGPLIPDADDVYELLYESKENILREWNLMQDVSISDLDED